MPEQVGDLSAPGESAVADVRDPLPFGVDGRLRREVAVARPFRHQRPDLAAGLALRPAVQTKLARRFEHRVTALVAGAGFGKTTALVQAFEENRLRPLGIDVWLACEPDDVDPQHFAIGLGASLGLDEAPTPGELVEVVAEWIGGRSPSQVCLVFDDTHLVRRSGASRPLRGGAHTVSLLAELIESLPSNGHLVLSGRTRPTVPLTRLELIGQSVTIGEDELRLPDDVAAALLDVPGDEDVTRFAGWPALIQLARRGGSTRFVVEEVIDLLTEEQFEVLRALVAIGEGDEQLLGEITGRDAAGALEEIPLVHRRGDRWGAHDLWSELIEVEDEIGIRIRAADVLIGRAAPERAVELLLPVGRSAAGTRGDGGDTTPDGRSGVDVAIDRALRAALLDPDLADPVAVRRWHDVIAPAGRSSPARELLGGLVLRLDNPGDEECHRLLQSAADGFLGDGDHAAAVGALSALCFAYHVRRDVAGLLATFGQLQTLADDGVAEAQPFPLLGAGLIATAQADPAAVLEHTEQLFRLDLSTEVRGVTLWLHANALCNLGHDAVQPAKECYEMGLPLPGMAMVYSNARLHAGLVEEMRSDPIVPVEGERDRFLKAAWDSVLAALLGEVDEARRHLEIVETSTADESRWQTIGSVAIPRALVAVVEHRDADAEAIVREFVDLTPNDGPGHFYYTASIGLIYPLVPELREWYRELDASGRLGPHHQRDLELTTAVVRLVEDGDLDAIREVRLPERVGEMMVSVAARFGALLLAACTTVQRPEAAELVADFVDLLGERAREQFRWLSDSPIDAVAAGARTILESIPVAPPERTTVSLLGGTELARGGRVVEHPDWRRERVRALLTYLVLNPDTTREAAIAALWPDADPTSGRRSLRSTLNMLHAVLEPERRGRDAPYFVRSVGQRLRLVVDDEHLAVDVERFASLLDRAVEIDEAGAPSQSIAPYLEAVSLYRGDLLPDSYDDWVVFARDRLRGRYVRGGVRAAELLIMTGRSDEAIDIAVRMLSVEPWSEPAHRVLIAAHLERGDVATARRCLETCERSLGDVGGPVDPETEELRRRLANR